MSKEEFTVLFRYLLQESKLTDNDVAKKVQCSRPTIDRWRRGVTAPHEIGRRSIIKYLLEEIAENRLE
jgi:transcriptional regulator with XRE-family HTH domain